MSATREEAPSVIAALARRLVRTAQERDNGSMHTLPLRPPLAASLVVLLVPFVAGVVACTDAEAAPVSPPGSASSKASPKPVPAACEEPFGLVARYDFAWLEENVCQLCGGADEEAPWCALDWPFSDVPSCDVWDEMRNGVFAYYGYPFKDARWKARFERERWYRRDEGFTPEKLPAPARRNVKLFKQFKEERRACFDEP